jgi:hypothetical protein
MACFSSLYSEIALYGKPPGTLYISVYYFIHWLYSPRGPWPLFQFPDLFTIGRAPWTCDQPVARPLLKHRTAQTQNKHIYYTLNIHALSGIRTHDHSVRASEDRQYLLFIGERALLLNAGIFLVQLTLFIKVWKVIVKATPEYLREIQFSKIVPTCSNKFCYVLHIPNETESIQPGSEHRQILYNRDNCSIT